MDRIQFLLRKIAPTAVIIILAFILPISASASTIIRRPNSAGDETQLTAVGNSTNWQNVNEETSDGNTTYNRTNSTSFVHDLYNITDLQEGDTVNSVKTYIVVRCETLSACTARTRIKTGGTTYNGSDNTPSQGSFSTFSTTYTNNPKTGVAWTVSDVNSLQIGADLQGWNGGDQDGYRCRLTQVYAEIDYTHEEATTTEEIVYLLGSSTNYLDAITATEVNASTTIYRVPFFDYLSIFFGVFIFFFIIKSLKTWK